MVQPHLAHQREWGLQLHLSSLNMLKMATPIKRKKTAKTQQSIYFAAEELKLQEPKTTVTNISIKVYEKLRPKTGGEISPRGVRPANIGLDMQTGGGNGPTINRIEITNLWTKSRMNTSRSVLGPRNRSGVPRPPTRLPLRR